jgi:hypothetical protein
MPAAQIDDLLLAARHLPLRDRALIDGVYRQGMSVVQIARASGMRPHSLRRRLRNLVRRLRSPLFRYVMREFALGGADGPSTRAAATSAAGKSQRERGLSIEHRRAIARAVVLDRRSQRQTALDLNITLHRLRRELDRLATLAEHEQC